MTLSNQPSEQQIQDFQIKEQDWIFTFGLSHGYANCYIRIHGTIESSRTRMNDLFGSHWAFQYPSEDSAGVKKWSLKELNPNDLPHLRKRI